MKASAYTTPIGGSQSSAGGGSRPSAKEKGKGKVGEDEMDSSISTTKGELFSVPSAVDTEITPTHANRPTPGPHDKMDLGGKHFQTKGSKRKIIGEAELNKALGLVDNGARGSEIYFAPLHNTTTATIQSPKINSATAQLNNDLNPPPSPNFEALNPPDSPLYCPPPILLNFEEEPTEEEPTEEEPLDVEDYAENEPREDLELSDQENADYDMSVYLGIDRPTESYSPPGKFDDDLRVIQEEFDEQERLREEQEAYESSLADPLQSNLLDSNR